MSLPFSDPKDQTDTGNACFRYIPAVVHADRSQHHANPQSSFHVIKPAQPSSPCSSSMTRSGNARTLFTIIPPMPQDTPMPNRVRYQLVFSFSLNEHRSLFEAVFSTDYLSIKRFDFVLLRSNTCLSLVTATTIANQRRSSCERRYLHLGWRVHRRRYHQVSDRLVSTLKRKGSSIGSVFSRQVGLNLVVPAGTKTVDASGKLVMPGKHQLSNTFFIEYKHVLCAFDL